MWALLHYESNGTEPLLFTAETFFADADGLEVEETLAEPLDFAIIQQ